MWWSRFWTRIRRGLRGGDKSAPGHQVKDWSESGRLEKEIRGESKAGYEVPGRLLQKADEMGRAQGVVRADSKEALAEGNGAHGYIDGAVGVRKTVREEATWKEVAPALRQSNSATKRAEGEADRAGHLRNHLHDLKERSLPATLTRLERARAELGKARQGLMEMPRLLRGYFSSPRPVALAAGAVVCFDGFVLHAVLATSGLDIVAIWGTTATVAAAIAAANHAFGVLAGAIGLAMPTRHRMGVAAVLFVAGLGSMLVAFLLLMVFRAEATSATNAALESIAKGESPTHLSFFISPLWMGPLQVGGSLAAISLTAFWTMAKEGREYTELTIVPAEVAVGAAAGEVAGVHAQIATATKAIENSVVAKHGIEADGLGAAADVAAALAANGAAARGEESLGEAAKGRYKASYAYHEKLYRNGGLYRMATESVRTWFTRRWRSRGAADRPASAAARDRRHPDPPPSGVRADWPWPEAPVEPVNGHNPASSEGGVS